MKLSKLTLLSLLISVVLSCQTKNTENTNKPKETSERIPLTSSGISIDYTSCGDQELSILFVHGWCIDQSYWDNQKEALCETYNVVTLDLPGFGKSTGERDEWSIENYGNDIVNAIDQLNLNRVVLVGHSMGGDIIMEAAIKRPTNVIALIGIDNFKDVGVEYSEQDHTEMAGFMEMLKEDFANIAPAYAQGMLFHNTTDSLVVQRVMGDIGNSNPEVAVSSLEYLFEYVDVERAKLSELKQKLYLINSDATPTNIEGLEATGVRYDLEYINATGHYPMIEKPEEFNRILKGVLMKIEEDHVI